MALTFYTNPMSRGQIVRWMLEEIGEPYEQVLLEFGTTMKGADYLAINPMGKVPCLVHDGHVITESAAICAYLAEAFPAAGLAPAADERADYFRWLFFAAGPLEQAITNKTVFELDPSGEQQLTAGYGSYEQTVDVLEQALTGRNYICGARFTAADVYVGAMVDWGMGFGTLPSRPAFEAYAARLRERPAYGRAKAIDQELMPQQEKSS